MVCRDMWRVSESWLRVAIRSIVYVERWRREERAELVGCGRVDGVSIRSGKRSSMTSRSGGVAKGESNGKASVCSMRVWWATWVASAV